MTTSGAVAKKPYILALVAFAAIPVVIVLGALLCNLINPEVAAGYPDYERNYRWLQFAKTSCLLASALVSVGLWVMTCFWLLKSKQQRHAWLVLAALGPVGLIVLTMLRDNAPAPGDRLQSLLGRAKFPLRMAYELCLFAGACVGAYQGVVLKRNLMLARQAAAAGTSTAQVIAQQNASSGMWAFSEGLEVLYLVALLYLLWPIGFNLACRLRDPDPAGSRPRP